MPCNNSAITGESSLLRSLIGKDENQVALFDQIKLVANGFLNELGPLRLLNPELELLGSLPGLFDSVCQMFMVPVKTPKTKRRSVEQNPRSGQGDANPEDLDGAVYEALKPM
jgi:hypothetical protein